MKYFLIAGERSGDLHGANLISALRESDPSASFTGVGGEQMQEAGLDLKIHYREMAFMGLWEVVQNLRTIRRYLKQTQALIEAESPDALILIDYGGFNMKIAAGLKKKNFSAPIFYYISPKVWAWNQKRTLKLKRTVDKMFVILPFEKAFFKGYDWDVSYVGNPVMDAVEKYKANTGAIQNREEVVALLPGSRKQELKYLLPEMQTLASNNAGISFYVATVDNLDSDLYADILRLPNVHAYSGNTYDLLNTARAAVVTSGTATLETALFKVPQVVIYRANPITYAIGSRLVKVPFISLVNLIADREVVKELLQSELNPKSLESAFAQIWKDGSARSEMMAGYNEVYETLSVGKASVNAAREMVQYLKESES